MLRCNLQRGVEPAVYNLKRVEEKPIPEMPRVDMNIVQPNIESSSESEIEDNNDTAHDAIDSNSDSNDAENSSLSGEMRETGDNPLNLNGSESTNDSNGGRMSRETSSTNNNESMNANDLESTDDLLPIETVFMPNTEIDENQHDDVIKQENVYEMNENDESVLNNILEDESINADERSTIGQQEYENNGNEHEQNEQGACGGQISNAIEQRENEIGNEKNAKEHAQNENEASASDGESSTDDSIIWIEDGETFPRPSHATADGLIKHEKDLISGALPFYVKVNEYFKRNTTHNHK